jgi:membrane-associated phospholipid phosphatase
MPSIHVATTAWIALALSSRWPKLRNVAWGYWLVIFIGSFALGWHYFLDGVVGTIGALGCWVLAKKLLAREGEEPRTGELAPIG